jgi:hypothetical protein
MEGTMKATGRTIKWMVMAGCTMKEENWLIKATGLKMNLMGSVKCTMTIL